MKKVRLESRSRKKRVLPVRRYVTDKIVTNATSCGHEHSSRLYEANSCHFSGTFHGISEMHQYLASAVFASGEIVSRRVAKPLLTFQPDSFHKKSHNHSLRLLDYMNVFRRHTLKNRNEVYIDGQTAETKPFCENSRRIINCQTSSRSFISHYFYCSS